MTDQKNATPTAYDHALAEQIHAMRSGEVSFSRPPAPSKPGKHRATRAERRSRGQG